MKTNIVTHDVVYATFFEAQCLARILQHVSHLTRAALFFNTLLHTLPYKMFDN